jgi:hypothetical protein
MLCKIIEQKNKNYSYVYNTLYTGDYQLKSLNNLSTIEIQGIKFNIEKTILKSLDPKFIDVFTGYIKDLKTYIFNELPLNLEVSIGLIKDPPFKEMIKIFIKTSSSLDKIISIPEKVFFTTSIACVGVLTGLYAPTIFIITPILMSLYLLMLKHDYSAYKIIKLLPFKLLLQGYYLHYLDYIGIQDFVVKGDSLLIHENQHFFEAKLHQEHIRSNAKKIVNEDLPAEDHTEIISKLDLIQVQYQNGNFFLPSAFSALFLNYYQNNTETSESDLDFTKYVETGGEFFTRSTWTWDELNQKIANTAPKESLIDLEEKYFFFRENHNIQRFIAGSIYKMRELGYPKEIVWQYLMDIRNEGVISPITKENLLLKHQRKAKNIFNSINR